MSSKCGPKDVPHFDTEGPSQLGSIVMFNVSWGEMLLIGAVALIIIGPRELPSALRTVGRTISRVRRLASEFQGHFNEALREADLDKVRKDVEGMNRARSAVFNPMKTMREDVRGAIDGSVASKIAAGAAASSELASSGAEAMPPEPERKPGTEPTLEGRNLT